MAIIATKRKEERSTKWNQFGTEFLPLWVADMDFVICPEIRTALEDCLRNETFGYTNTWPSLNQSVVSWCQQQYQWEIESDWIVWTPGVAPAFMLTNQLFSQSQKSIVIPKPTYPPLLNSAKNLDLSHEFIPHYYQNGRWHLDFEKLEKLIQQRSISLASLANPANPLGYCLTRDELIRLTSLCEENGVLICSDEIHCDLILDDMQHIPMGKIAPQNSITLMAASKTFNIAGLNTSFAIIPDQNIRQQFKMASHQRNGSPSLLGFVATETAFTFGKSWLHETKQYLRKNREILFNWGQEMKLCNHYLPSATHLYWFKIPIQKWIDQNVMPSNGADFGESGYSRINFACDSKLLIEAISRISM